MIPTDHSDADLPDDLRKVLQDVKRIEVPEPSPLFWDHVAERVSAAIDRPAPAMRPWWSPGRLGWAAAAAVLVIGLVAFSTTRGSHVPAQIETPPVAAVAGGDATPVEGIEPDEAWALVSGFADELHYDDMEAAGVIPRPGSIERAAIEMSDDERAELVRLLQDEMKRTGA